MPVVAAGVSETQEAASLVWVVLVAAATAAGAQPDRWVPTGLAVVAAAEAVPLVVATAAPAS